MQKKLDEQGNKKDDKGQGQQEQLQQEQVEGQHARRAA